MKIIHDDNKISKMTMMIIIQTIVTHTIGSLSKKKHTNKTINTANKRKHNKQHIYIYI